MDDPRSWTNEQWADWYQNEMKGNTEWGSALARAHDDSDQGAEAPQGQATQDTTTSHPDAALREVARAMADRMKGTAMTSELFTSEEGFQQLSLEFKLKLHEWRTNQHDIGGLLLEAAAAEYGPPDQTPDETPGEPTIAYTSPTVAGFDLGLEPDDPTVEFDDTIRVDPRGFQESLGGTTVDPPGLPLEEAPPRSAYGVGLDEPDTTMAKPPCWDLERAQEADLARLDELEAELATVDDPQSGTFQGLVGAIRDTKEAITGRDRLIEECRRANGLDEDDTEIASDGWYTGWVRPAVIAGAMVVLAGALSVVGGFWSNDEPDLPTTTLATAIAAQVPDETAPPTTAAEVAACTPLEEHDMTFGSPSVQGGLMDGSWTRASIRERQYATPSFGISGVPDEATELLLVIANVPDGKLDEIVADPQKARFWDLVPLWIARIPDPSSVNIEEGDALSPPPGVQPLDREGSFPDVGNTEVRSAFISVDGSGTMLFTLMAMCDPPNEYWKGEGTTAPYLRGLIASYSFVGTIG